MTYLERLKKIIEERGGKEAVFKEEVKGRYRIASLFWERRHDETDAFEPIYSLVDYEVNGKVIPLKRLYLEIADPTEYEFARLCFFNFEHYVKAMRSAYFKAFIDRCRDELEMQLRSQAVNRIKDIAKSGKDAAAITAAKYIIERGWMGSRKERDAIVRRKKQDKEINNVLEQDLELLAVKPVGGFKEAFNE